MLCAFKLGPIGVGRDRVNVYAAVWNSGISRLAFAKSEMGCDASRCRGQPPASGLVQLVIDGIPSARHAGSVAKLPAGPDQAHLAGRTRSSSASCRIG